jgi:hypothetical protein
VQKQDIELRSEFYTRGCRQLDLAENEKGHTEDVVLLDSEVAMLDIRQIYIKGRLGRFNFVSSNRVNYIGQFQI